MDSKLSERTEDTTEGRLTTSDVTAPLVWPVLPDIGGITNFRFDFPPISRMQPHEGATIPPPEFVFPFTGWVAVYAGPGSNRLRPQAEVWFGTDDPRNKIFPFNLPNPSDNRVITYGIYHLLSKLPYGLSMENGTPIRLCIPKESVLDFIKAGRGQKVDLRLKLRNEALRLWEQHGIEVQLLVTEKRYDGRGIKFQEFIDGKFSLDDKKGQEDYRSEGVTVAKPRSRVRISSLRDLVNQ